MKQIYYLFLLITVITVSCSSSSNTPIYVNDINDLCFASHIGEVESINMKILRNGKNHTADYIYVFDDFNRIIQSEEIIHFYGNSSEKTLYEYDDSNNIVSKRKYDEYDELAYTSKFNYDKKEGILYEESVSANAETYTFYDSNDEKVTVESYTSYFSEYEYDNNLLKSIKHFNSNYEEKEVYTFTYHSNGKIKQVLEDEIPIFDFNSDGFVDKINNYGSRCKYVKYTEFDKRGNWTKADIVDPSPYEIESTLVREITYK